MNPANHQTVRGPWPSPPQTRALAAGFRLGSWSVEPAAHRLSRNGRTVHLEPKVMAVLVLLAERAGKVVEKDEIIHAVWPDTVVSEVSVPRCVSELRRALDDDAREPRFIETIPKKGYRLIRELDLGLQKDASPQSEIAAEAGSWGRTSHLKRPTRRTTGAIIAVLVAVAAAVGAIQQLTPRSADAIDSLAVLPLRNLSDRVDEEYFADAMTDLLITDLAQLGRFRVISATSVMRFKGRSLPVDEIARELGVDAIIEGSILRADDRVRITVQLIDGGGERHLWAETYERRVDDVLDLQSEVARAIAHNVDDSLAPSRLASIAPRHTVDPEAFDLYLKGRQLWKQRGPEELRQAIEYFRKSLEIDPDNAFAYAGLGDVYSVQSTNGQVSHEIGVPKAKRAVLKALLLDDQVAEAHIALAMIRYVFERDWYSAEEHFRRGVALNPSYATGRQWYAMFLATHGRFKEGVAEAEAALKLDPLNVQTHLNVSRVFLYAGLYGRALEVLDEVARMESVCQEYVTRQRELATILHQGGSTRNARLAALYAKKKPTCSGMDPEQCSNYPYARALKSAAAGKDDDALRYLEMAHEIRDPWLVDMAVDPLLEPLRGDPRFLAIAAALDLEGVQPPSVSDPS